MSDFPAPWVETVAHALHHRVAVSGMPHRSVAEQDEHADRDWHARPEADRDLFRSEARTVLARLDQVCTLAAPCDQCGGPGWTRIMGKVTGALSGYETVVECQACNSDRRIPYYGQPELYDVIAHHLAHQTPPGVFDPTCPACRAELDGAP